MMEEHVKQAYLYDFYGELLNDRQRQIFEDYVLNDLSLGEIADQEGISRQGVHDMVKRCIKALESYEQKLHLLEKFLKVKKQVGEIQSLAEGCQQGKDDTALTEINRISGQILEEL